MRLQLNANHLKLIAIIAMTIDHICDLIYPGFPPEPGAVGLHIIGRLTAPIMWFFVCEGYYYTHNVKKYMIRMGIFGCLATDDNGNNFALSYQFKQVVWGQGYASQGVAWLLAYMKEKYGTVTLIAEVLTINVANVKILERVNFHAASEREVQCDSGTFVVRKYVKGEKENEKSRRNYWEND